MHSPAITKAHLMFGRVNIDIHQGRVQLQVEHKRRMTTVIQNIPISLTHRVGHQFVPDYPTVDKEILQIAAGPRERR